MKVTILAESAMDLRKKIKAFQTLFDMGNTQPIITEWRSDYRVVCVGTKKITLTDGEETCIEEIEEPTKYVLENPLEKPSKGLFLC